MSNSVDLFGCPIKGESEGKAAVVPVASLKRLETPLVAVSEALSYFESFGQRDGRVIKLRGACLIWY
jgi:hypothetical protein